MVLKKSKKDNSTLFIEASKEFLKVTNNNKLTEDNIQNILKLFENRNDIQYLCKLVPNSDIVSNGYNLSVSLYVETENVREIIDIDKLNSEIESIVLRENDLRQEIDKIISELRGEWH